MSESLRQIGIETEDMYHTLVQALRERAKENKESRAIHAFVTNLSEHECRGFMEDAIHHFMEAENAHDYGNVMARSLHMYGYEIYPRLKEWC